MSLKPGRYQIRYIPPGITPPFVGGLYAVSTDIGQPILAEPLSSEHPPQVVSSPHHFWITHLSLGEKNPSEWEQQVHHYTTWFQQQVTRYRPSPHGMESFQPIRRLPRWKNLVRSRLCRAWNWARWVEWSLLQYQSSWSKRYGCSQSSGILHRWARSRCESIIFPRVISTFNIPLIKLVSQPYWPGLGLRRPHPNWEFIPDKRN